MRVDSIGLKKLLNACFVEGFDFFNFANIRK